uniref:Uncharacterized protein n=1 Tax=Candidozyma auris TaxID=498019 RepID=A0A0L0NSA7_CANAR
MSFVVFIGSKRLIVRLEFSDLTSNNIRFTNTFDFFPQLMEVIEVSRDFRSINAFLDVGT